MGFIKIISYKFIIYFNYILCFLLHFLLFPPLFSSVSSSVSSCFLLLYYSASSLPPYPLI